MFGLAFQLRVGFPGFCALTALAGLVGLSTNLATALGGRRMAAYRLLLVVGAGLTFLVCGLTPSNLR
jgi:hypothetical protein